MSTGHFNALARALHWTMAALILAMLFIGVVMVSSLTERPWLIGLHRPLGIAIGFLAVVRLANRLSRRTPPLPADLPALQAFAAHASHWLLYALMLALPLVGWAMVSAGGFPVTLFAGLAVPAIAPHDATWYAVLRQTHGALAAVLFLVILAHLAGALYHAWVRRDGVFSAMARGRDAP